MLHFNLGHAIVEDNPGRRPGSRLERGDPGIADIVADRSAAILEGEKPVRIHVGAVCSAMGRHLRLDVALPRHRVVDRIAEWPGWDDPAAQTLHDGVER